MADWYTLSHKNDKLVKFHEPHQYHNVENYLCTVPRPDLVNGEWVFPDTVLTAVRDIFKSTGSKKSKKRNSCNSEVKGPAPKKRSSGRSMFLESEEDSDNCSTSSKSNKRVKTQLPSKTKNDPVTMPPLKEVPKEGQYVLVEFATSNKKKDYIAKILKEADAEGDLEVSYLRRSVKGVDTFCLPPVPDLASVPLELIKMILPSPTYDERSSVRQRSLYKFDVTFDGLNVC